MTIWRKFVVLGILGYAGVSTGAAQRHDQYVYDKLQEQEKHIDYTDIAVKENAKLISDLRAQLDQYRDYAIGFSGCLTLFIGILRFLGRKGESS